MTARPKPWRKSDMPRARHTVVIVGAGQAGLAVSRELQELGVDHVVLDQGRVGETWRGRWDSFCLVTPNWSMQLPGQPYDGANPDAFDPRDEIVGFLSRYATRFELPVEEGVEVRSLRQARRGGFVLDTSAGRLEARSVVLATGAYQRPHRPAAAAALPASVLQIDIGDYKSPAELPSGPVLVVGSGQSGCQIAEELHRAGRGVFLACGRAPWAPRRFGGHDLFWWLQESGFLDAPVTSLPSPAARLSANILTSGHDGGHDLHLRTLSDLGVTLLGHLLGADSTRARFAPDLAESVAWGDERHAQLAALFRKCAAEHGLPDPGLPEPHPFVSENLESLSLNGFGAVIFAGGFRPDYTSWVHVPNAFDEHGFPVQNDGTSTAAPGLHFAGVHFLRKRKSSLFIGVGEDAAVVARNIARAEQV
jgi:putative flavoprotein involved in K+ transport